MKSPLCRPYLRTPKWKEGRAAESLSPSLRVTAGGRITHLRRRPPADGVKGAGWDQIMGSLCFQEHFGAELNVLGDVIISLTVCPKLEVGVVDPRLTGKHVSPETCRPADLQTVVPGQTRTRFLFELRLKREQLLLRLRQVFSHSAAPSSATGF